MFRTLLFPLGSLAMLLSGCGDDVNTTPIDASNPIRDAAPDSSPDAVSQEFLNHEGGEVRVEWVEKSNGTTTTTEIIAYSFFLSSQTPEKIPYPGDGCTQLKGYTNTTNATTAVNDTRTYMDVGATVKLVGAGREITLSKAVDKPDKRALPMDIGYFGGVAGAHTGAIASSQFLRGGTYDVVTASMGTLPVPLKLPGQWETIGGNLNFAPNAVNTIPANTDVSWQYAFPDEDRTNTGILLFSGNNLAGVREVWFCVHALNGRVDIPAAMMATFPPTGTVQAATISHQKIDWNGRVVDLLGVTCKQTPYTRL